MCPEFWGRNLIIDFFFQVSFVLLHPQTSGHELDTNTIMKNILLIIFLITLLVFLFAGIAEAGIKDAKRNCLIWEERSETYTNYYFTNWQKEQCKKYGYDF